MRPSADRLLERAITFNYDFRMRCEKCGQTSSLSGHDYRRLEAENEARMDCEHCDGSIHFGPRAAGIRDEDDPALDDTLVNQLAWYHSSTYQDWPSPDFEGDLRAEFTSSKAVRLMGDPERYISGQLDKALHLGTYEAAIENMYRRMRNQADQDAQFYLHRVRVDISAGRVNGGYHDENDEPAASVSLSELRDLDLDAIRYLNVWEASGCVSLAVNPTVLVDVQTVKIPADRGRPHLPDAALLKLVADLKARNAETTTSTEERTFRGYGLMNDLQEALVDRLLPKVNLEVAEEFVRAVRAIGRYDDTSTFDDVARNFARHAHLLSEPEAIQRLMDEAPRRDVRTQIA